jgi:hypothetical protein
VSALSPSSSHLAKEKEEEESSFGGVIKVGGVGVREEKGRGLEGMQNYEPDLT